MAPMNRYRRSYPGLSPDQRQSGVDDHLRPWLAQLKEWQHVIKPAAAGPWFAIDDAMRSLNKLAEAFTGEPLWKSLGNHGAPKAASASSVVDPPNSTG